MSNLDDRIVVLVDMDCFFCQVEVKLQPNLKGKPLAVVQYNQWQNGGIIAVNYEARDQGVSRHMRPDEAKKKCPNLVLATVPGVRGKADTSRYRIAGREVVEVLSKHSKVIERASVDEAYLDITELVNKEISQSQPTVTEMMEELQNTFVIGYSTPGNNDEAHRREAVQNWLGTTYGELGDIQSRRLAVAGTIVERIRADIYDITGYRCSAGVSYNKILAKLACGLHKPNRQTILPLAGVPSLFKTLPVKKVRNLGGKFGDVVIESLGCNVMADLLSYSLRDLQQRFDDKTGLWLYNIARGTDNEPVTNRLITKSIGSCKNFPGKRAIVDKETLEHWVTQLSLEMNERLDQDLEENNRKATLLTVSYHYYKDNKTVSQSRSSRLTTNKAEALMKSCLDTINKYAKYPIVFMGMSASKFIDIDKETANFRNFFTASKNGFITNDESPSTSVSSVTELRPVSPETPIVEFEVKAESGRSPVDEKCSSTFIPKDTNAASASGEDDSGNAASSSCATSSVKKEEIKSPMSLLTSENAKLKPDNFKKSFFMNILSASKNRPEDKPLRGIDEEVEKIKDPSSTGSFKDAFVDESDSIIGPSTSKSSLKENDDLEKGPGDESLAVTSSASSYFDNQRKSGSSLHPQSPKDGGVESDRLKSNRTEVKADDDNTVKLQDIFPDLDNIDESIVAVLPARLQREARLILQSKKKNLTDIKTNGVKIGEQKIKDQNKRPRERSITQVRISRIDTFFTNEVKSTTNSIDNEFAEKCPDCDRLIPLNDYPEHLDFHVARNLSKEINMTYVSAKTATPERETSNGKTVKRKRNKPDTREPEKKAKGIAVFFS